MSDIPFSSRTRAGAGLFKALLVIVVVGALGALTWVTIANWRKSGEFSFRVFDPDWWTLNAPRDHQVADPASGVVDQAKAMAGKAKDALWGKGGLIERCEEWWNGHPKPTDTAAPATSASADRGRLEHALAEADAEFRLGLDAYKRANPGASGTNEDKRAFVASARGHFLKAGEVLKVSLPAYDALPEHDAGISRSAHQLQDYDQQLLEMTTPAR